MTDIVGKLPELPEPEIGYIKTDKSNQPAFSARQMQAYARAALAEAKAVPMNAEAAWEASCVNSDWEAVDAYMQGIADAEAHYGITAPAGGDG